MKKNNRRGVILVISSPSGAGKTTICKQIIEKVDGVCLSVSVTTRKKRQSEVEGKDYFFENKKNFLHMVKNNKFIENAKVFGNHYGTLKDEVLKKIEDGIDVLVDIDWQGTQQLAEHVGSDLVRVFILPPSTRELERRLRSRAQDPVSVVDNRMAKAMDEISHYPEYDYIIVNTVLEESISNLRAILTSERLKRRRQIGLTDFVKKLRERC